jgi:hypothetical protein
MIDSAHIKRAKLASERRVYLFVLHMIANAYHLPLVVGGKHGFDALYLTAPFFFGHVTAQL